MGDAYNFDRIVRATGKATGRTLKAFTPDVILDLPKKLAERQGRKDNAIMDNYYKTVKVARANEAALKGNLTSLIEEREDNKGQIELLQKKVIALSSSVPRTTRPSGKPSHSAAARAERAKTKIATEIAGALTKITERAAIVGKIDTTIDTVVMNSILNDKMVAEDMRRNGPITRNTGRQNTLTQVVLRDQKVRGMIKGLKGGVKTKVYKKVVKKTTKPVAKRPSTKRVAKRVAKRPVARRA
jgi:hypothetical protein